jgi:signal transduction histidine kinase
VTVRLHAILGGAALIVALIVMALNNCWCDAERVIVRGVLVALVCVAWAVELMWGRWPRLIFALLVAIPIANLIVTDNASVAPLFLLLMVGWVVYTGSLRDGVVATVASCVAILGYLRFDTPDRWLPWILGISATGLMMRMVVMQQSLVQQLRLAQADLARQAAADERRRIAGEIHDVAAHSLAVTLLHLTGARLRVQREAGQPWLVEALAQAERLGRQSLDDVRRTVGLLSDDAGVLAPLPGLAELPGLVEEYRAAGLQVAFHMHGDASVPPATGLALYRIVQEGLANAVKHAPGAPVEVDVDIAEHVRLRMCNPLSANGHSGDAGTGLGVGGMRERTQSLGGTFRAGARDASWIVECQLPR